MHVLLTGSNGFLGSRIVADAHARGWRVTGVGRAPRPASPVDAYVRQDLAAARLPDAVAPVDAVIHCAALASPWAAPADFIAANVSATRNVARWAAGHGAPPFVYVSSSSVLYRDADQFDLTEDSPVPADADQINVYSRTKRIGERIVARYPGRHVILRPRAVFGVGDTVLLPRILRIARRGVLPAFERTPGRIVADLTDVHTAAHYITEALERGVDGLYHLTNAEPVALYPFLLSVLARLGVKPRPVPVPVPFARSLARAGEVASARWGGWGEPPITRYGVSVLSRSKTFDVAATLRDLGAPAVGLDEAVDRLVADALRSP